MGSDFSLIEYINYSIVKIDCTYTDGGSGSGTGFFFMLNGNQRELALITNRHVMDGVTTATIVLCKKGEDGGPLDKEHYKIILKNFEGRLKNHPDESIDLCAVLIGDVIAGAQIKSGGLFASYMDQGHIATKENIAGLDVMEEIFMVGYPNALWDSVNNKPIIRKGVTATHPKFDYNEKSEFLIDAACFPGSSGSPVFHINTKPRRGPDGLLRHGQKNVLFLGVLYSGPEYVIKGRMESTADPSLTGLNDSVPVTGIPYNLGHIIKAHKILDFINVFGLT